MNESPWTWADQISSYRFWGIFLFFIFILLPNVFLNFSYPIFTEQLNLRASQIGTALSIKSIAGFGGFWLAWFLVRLKNHFLLYLYSAFIIIGLLLVYFIPTSVSIAIGFFLIGLGFGAVALSIPAIIAGGRGSSEMFVVSFGLITFYELVVWSSFSNLYGWFFTILNGYRAWILIALIGACIGTILLIPVKATLFNSTPPKREFSLTPRFREPVVVALLCLVPLFNIYYIIRLSYRYHGEVNTINPTQNILSPCSAAWCTILLSVLMPVMTASLNQSLICKLTEDGKLNYYRNWAVILWTILFVPVSFALIQSNMNKLIGQNRPES